MAAPLTLADDYWMVAHDNRGSSYLRPRPLGIGLGVALLCELVLLNVITNVRDGHLYLDPQEDRWRGSERWDWDLALVPLLQKMLDEAASTANGRHRPDSEPVGLEIRLWVEYLEQGPAQQFVQRRLAATDLVETQTVGGRLRGYREVMVPRSSNLSGWPIARIKGELRQGRHLTMQDLTLAALLLATGMKNRVLDDVPPGDLQFLIQQMKSNMGTPLQELIIGAEQAIDRLAKSR